MASDLAPNLFLIGAPKCGTTSLAEWMAEHSDIGFAAQKEPHWYSDDIAYGNRVKSRADYLHLFAGSDSKPWRAEGSTWYLFSQTAVPRIMSEVPEARFIVMVRNPVDLAPSLHAQNLDNGTEDIGDFAEAWAAQSDRARGRRVPSMCPEPKMLQYGPASLLGEQVTRLYRHVPSDRVHLIFLEDIVRDDLRELDRLQDFLRITNKITARLPHANPARTPRSIAMRRAVRLLATLKSRLGVSRSFGVLKRATALNARPGRRMTVAEETRSQMRAFFRDDVHALADITGRNLDHWLMPASR